MRINNEYCKEVEFDGKKFKTPYKSRPYFRTVICGANRTKVRSCENFSDTDESESDELKSDGSESDKNI